MESVIFALLKFTKTPQTFRFCCHWRAASPELGSCGCLQCCPRAGWLFLGTASQDPGWPNSLGGKEEEKLPAWWGHWGDMVQIPSGVTWDFSLGSLRAAGNSPSSGQSCPFSVLWGFSLGLSSFSQPPWSRPAEMEILRVASPLLCLDGGINNGFISQPACFAGQCL